ncbi:hypothetical protein [Sedimenticola sp.]|uniref:hypothetical protein n=1 Tax=Sedimenticola sp. TaxID=1940285 RepID=UPI0025885B4C|nr:hypothetical protein [Sedimenticola sp.]MCW8904642.1 hypothetical protein [Sedimenticola sp.]
MDKLAGMLLLTALLVGAGPALSGEQQELLFENDSAHDIKVVGPGRAFILTAGAPAERVTFEADDSLGVQLNIWWKHNPRELCQLFTPWSRRVRIAGRQTIVCMSGDN